MVVSVEAFTARFDCVIVFNSAFDAAVKKIDFCADGGALTVLFYDDNVFKYVLNILVVTVLVLIRIVLMRF